MRRLKVHALYEYGINSEPHCSAYVRLLFPLAYPTNVEAFEFSHGTTYARADVIIVERLWKPDISLTLAEELVEQVRKDGACLIYTIDDNLLDLNTKTEEPVRRGFTVEQLMIVRYFAREADGIIVSTEPLKERLSRFNQNIIVVQNSLDERLFEEEFSYAHPVIRNDNRKIIGYMGTFTHDADLMMILQALREVLKKHQNTLEFQLIGSVSDPAVIQAFNGLPLQILDVGQNGEYPNFIRWMRQTIRWDIGIAPLEDNAFTRCKSDIKFLDYSALGIAGIYSKVKPYENSVCHLETGYLCSNDANSWVEAFESLITDDNLRQNLVKQAQSYTLSTRTLKHCAQNWEKAIFSIWNTKQLEVVSTRNSTTAKTKIPRTTSTNLGPISVNNTFCQTFLSTGNGLCAISLWVATYCKQINSFATLSIFDLDIKDILRQVKLDTKDFSDNSWQKFSFEPIDSSKNKVYWFCFETNGRDKEAITLWTNTEITGICQKNGRYIDEAICFVPSYSSNAAYLLDHLLFNSLGFNFELPFHIEESLHRILIDCINKRLFFLRLAHLANAFGKTKSVRRILSIGSGAGYQEAFLAARFPHIQVDVVDLCLSPYDFQLPNLSFTETDILDTPEKANYDLVISIKCLEHIENYRLAFKNMAAKVQPGKYMYISVPFASQEEQRNEILRQQEWENHKHYLPGFTFEDLETMFQENNFEVIYAANMFDWRLQISLDNSLGRMSSIELENRLEEVVSTFLKDLDTYRVSSRQEGALGVCFLGQKRG